MTHAASFAVQIGFDAFRIAIGLKPNHPYEEVIRWLHMMHEKDAVNDPR